MTEPREPVFLLEVGTEEIPDRFLSDAATRLACALMEALAPHQLFEDGSGVSTWSTPRRLAVACGPLRVRQVDREETVIGPPARAAFTPEGRPTKAAEGFARGLGLGPGELIRVQTEKGEYVAARRFVAGRSAADLLAAAATEAIGKLHFPKMMRWGEGTFRFVRPVRWIVALLDDDLIALEAAGVRSGRLSRGPRHQGSPELVIPRATAYVEALRASGVIVDPEERRSRILAGLERAAAELGGEPVPDPDLAEILVHMTEHPAVIAGRFSPEFLDLPREVLVTAMRHHQRYFSMVAGGDLRPAFLAVLNRPDDPQGTILRGHEWVLRARLSDARFFWQEDRRHLLQSRLTGLDRVVFQEKLGSYGQKVERLERLVEELGRSVHLPAETVARARRAAHLAKCDLTTEVVKEFPELQGIMGSIYARADGEPPEIAAAIADHYRPAGSGDLLPSGDEGRLLALADRLDTLAGAFGIGLEPTGTRDPFALRRAGQGVVRLLFEHPWFLSLSGAVGSAFAAYPESIRGDGGAAVRLVVFLQERARQVAQAGGDRYDSVAAVLAVQGDDLHDARLRLQALSELRAQPAHEAAFVALSGSCKRIRNFVDGGAEVASEIDRALLTEPPEQQLDRELSRVEAEVTRQVDARAYLQALGAIASLRPALDGFLGGSRGEGVLVLAPDARVRRNRLALLMRAGRLFSWVADFSAIVLEGGADGVASTRFDAREEGRLA
jgi:glycyl-tRNA synthetase beta chain